MDTFAETVVDAINEVSGAHPGHRAAHAKGTLMAGSFSAAPRAAELTTAMHMQGDRVRVTARLSNGGGNPQIPDYAREGRGLAVKFYLPDGSTTDIIGLTLPCFFVRTAEDFLDFTNARRDPEKLMPAFLGAHPEALPAIQAALGAEPPESYATCAYNSIHSFRWTGPDATDALGALSPRARGGRELAERRGGKETRARLPAGGAAQPGGDRVSPARGGGRGRRRHPRPHDRVARRARARGGRAGWCSTARRPSASAATTSSCSIPPA